MAHAIETDDHKITVAQTEASEGRLVSCFRLRHTEQRLQHHRLNAFLATSGRFDHIPALLGIGLGNRRLTVTQSSQLLFTLGFHGFACANLGQLGADAIGNLLKRQLLRFVVLFNAHHHHCVRIKLDHTAVAAVFQHFITECRLNHLTIGRQTFSAALATERFGRLDLQAEFLSGLSQVR